jgi:TolA-binding protein
MNRYLRFLLPAILVLSGCVYFNTFYNARTYFSQAESEYERSGDKLTPQARASYEKVIEKCSKVLQFYPTSKYVDDALFLMGVSHSRLGEREKGKRKFEELVDFYPNSPFVPRAHLELASLYIDIMKFDLARYELDRVAGDLAEEATLIKARSYYEEKDYANAQLTFEDFLTRFPRSNLRKEVYFLAASSSKEKGDLDEANRYLREHLEFFLTDEEELEAREILGDILYGKGENQQALDVFSALDLTPESQDARRIQIKSAMCHEGLGDTEKAKSIYRAVIDAQNKSSEGVEAMYRLALIYENEDSLDLALTTFEEASKVFGEHEYKRKASFRAHALSSLLNIEDADAAESRMRVAEIYLFELDRQEEALDLYRSVYEDFPEEELAPKALYAVIYIQLRVIPDTTGAEASFSLLTSNYPESVYLGEVERNFGVALGVE